MKITKKFSTLQALGKIALVIAVVLAVGGGVFWQPALADEDGTNRPRAFLPLALSTGGTAARTSGPVMLGVYPKNWWDPKPEEVVKQLHELDRWAGKTTSIAGVFHNIEDTSEANVVRLFGVIWDAGYTPFANLYSSHSAKDIAGGKIDASIRTWARNYATYTQNGSRTAFLAPLQEMNGSWVPYSGDPTNYIAAYKRIQRIFKDEGVPDGSVIWVFAPNGYSGRGELAFESYYPGNDSVDVVAFSGYNFGCHPATDYPKWDTPEAVFGAYLPRLREMAPGKPIFVAQTGTSGVSCSGDGKAEKNAWLQQAYTYLASQPGVQGIVYYNANGEFDFAFYQSGGSVAYEGYRKGISHMAYDYVPPKTMKQNYR